MPPKRPDSVQTAIYAWPEPPVTTSSVGKHYNSIVRDVDGRVTVFRVGDVALFEAEGSHVPYCTWASLKSCGKQTTWR